MCIFVNNQNNDNSNKTMDRYLSGMKTPRLAMWARNRLESLQVGHLQKYPALSAHFWRQNLWLHFLQHGVWIDLTALYSPIGSEQMIHKSVDWWHSSGSSKFECRSQYDLNGSINSKWQFLWEPQVKWKVLRHFFAQQLILAPFSWQNMHLWVINGQKKKHHQIKRMCTDWNV